MEIKTLKNTGIGKIANTFNLSFSDYFVPIHLTAEQLLSKMKADKINLDYSVGVFENENLVAFILHGTDTINNKKVVYNGGTGVIPDKRGQGLTKQMYNYILPILREESIDYLVLEAISDNIQAIKSYQKSGFEITRVLKCYKGHIRPTQQIDSISIHELENYDWPLMQSFWDFTPSWQNSPNIADELKNTNKSIGAYVNNILTGYLIYNPASKRIQQLAVDKNFRRMKIASALINVIIKEYGNDLSIINVDESAETMNLFLPEMGFENYINQVEMKLELSA